MTHRDALVLALRSLVRRPLRSALTVAAVALGTGLLVALTAIAGTADSRIINELGKGGPASAIRVVAAEPDPSAPDTDQLRTGRPRDLDEAALRAIRRAPDVASVQGVLQTPVEVIALPPLRGLRAGAGGSQRPTPFEDNLIGADLSRPRNLPVTVLAGRLPATHSLTEVTVTLGYLDRLTIDVDHPEAVLGTEIEFGAPQVESGSTVRLRGRWFRARVVGVVAQQIGDGDFLVPLDQTRLARTWELGGGQDPDGNRLPTSPYSGLIVVASTLDQVHTVRASITVLGYATSAPEHLVASVLKYLHVVDIVLGGIGTVALVIAVLGIANALFAAVRERHREIGVLKAIGARDRDVLRWFELEALLVGTAGGLLGGALGLGVAAVVGGVVNGYLVAQGLEGIDLGSIPWGLGLLGMAGSMLLAVLAGALPALRAARLPARDAVGSL
ncbi:MAG: transporter [Chloroflexi bacterium]|nr:transporter [Chloroflexota bacterium]